MFKDAFTSVWPVLVEKISELWLKTLPDNLRLSRKYSLDWPKTGCEQQNPQQTWKVLQLGKIIEVLILKKCDGHPVIQGGSLNKFI